MQPIEALGFWHLPDDPENRIAGTLRFDPQEGIRLSLSGSFRGAEDFWSSLKGFMVQGKQRRRRDYDLIHGIVDKTRYGSRVSLVNGLTTKQTLRSVGFATEEVRVDVAYVGDHWLENEQSKFTGVTIGLEGLPEWLGKTGLKRRVVRDNDDIAGIDIQYRTPAEERLRWNDIPFEIAYQWSGNSDRYYETISEDAYLRFHYFAPESFESLMTKYVSPIQDLLTFATNRANLVSELSVTYDGIVDEESGQHACFHILYPPIYPPLHGRRIQWTKDMLFMFSEIDDRQNLLDRWREFRLSAKRFCSLFFSDNYARSRYLDDRFMQICYALEALLVRQVDDAEVSAGLASLREKVAVLGESAIWSAAVVPSFSEIYFPVNLLNSIQQRQELIGPLLGQEPQAFVNRVVATWADLRGRETDSSLVLHDGELFWAFERLRAIAKVCVMEILGLQPDMIRKIVKRNETLNRLTDV